MRYEEEEEPGPPVRTGGQLVADQLRRHGVHTVFCVPGESYLPFLDAMYDTAQDMRLVVARHEGAAATMAEAYGKLTGEPGICFVTRGPGATNASIGVHTAMQDSTPLILFVGQVSTQHSGREAFQELDYPQVFGGMAKWATQVNHVQRIPEIVHRAFVTATAGRPGPVVVALPEDVLTATASIADARPYRRVHPAPPAAAVAELAELLATAHRPLLVVGGSGWDQATTHSVRTFAERWDLPAVTSFRRQDLFNHESDSYAAASVREPDPTWRRSFATLTCCWSSAPGWAT